MEAPCTYCVDCSSEAHIFRDDVYGAGHGTWYCDVCYASNYFPDAVEVAATRLGVNGTIEFIPDDSECVACLAPASHRYSEAWDKAQQAEGVDLSQVDPRVLDSAAALIDPDFENHEYERGMLELLIDSSNGVTMDDKDAIRVQLIERRKGIFLYE